MSDSTDWQTRFQALAVEQEEDNRRHAEAEQTLCRTIIRLCAATSGLDPTLDPHLTRMRKAVKDGYSPQLVQRLSELSDELVKSEDKGTEVDLFASLLRHSQLGSKQQRRAAELWQKISKAPADSPDKMLDELAEMLGWTDGGTSATSDEGTGSGIFGRLLRSKSGAAADPNQTLAGLLGKVEWPQKVKSDIAEMSEALTNNAPQDAWVGVVERLSSLVLEVLQGADNEMKAAGEFLAALTDRLDSIDQHMRGESDRRKASRESGERLGDSVRAEVGDISDSMRDSADLGQLVEMVSSSLDRIQQHVERHLAGDIALHQEAEQREQAMRQSLAALDQEAEELRRRLAQTEEQALRDALTGLPNRRAYDERVAEECARLKRFGAPLSLVVWDLDNFKQVNDKLGHKAGDKALKVVGELLAKGLRETDFIARYGGEEFVVLLPGATVQDALPVAEKMRQAVENAGLHSNKKPVELTVSGGIARFANGEDPSAVFERADKALYQAKAEGKNRCIIADGSG